MKKKILIFILIAIFMYAIGGIIYYKYFKEEKEVITNIASIEGYDYKLQSNATELMKAEFEVLKTNLESVAINEEEYAKSITKLFIIDLYTISNKLNKYDVGGIAYVLPAAADNYKINVKDTLYKYVEDNTDNKRVQELPTVKSISVTEIEAAEFETNDITYSGYLIKLAWEYNEDLGYDTEAEVNVIKEDKYYYITEKK